MPIFAATLIASSLSFCHIQPLCMLKGCQGFINTPTTLNPCFLSNAAATELSTPPDMATKTFLLRGVFDCLCLFQILAIFVSFTPLEVRCACTSADIFDVLLLTGFT